MIYLLTIYRDIDFQSSFEIDIMIIHGNYFHVNATEPINDKSISVQEMAWDRRQQAITCANVDP